MFGMEFQPNDHKDKNSEYCGNLGTFVLGVGVS